MSIFEHDKSLMKRLTDGRISLDRIGFPHICGHRVPRGLWCQLPSSMQKTLEESPPVEVPGTPGKPFSQSPKCWSGDKDEYQYNEMQGYND